MRKILVGLLVLLMMSNLPTNAAGAIDLDITGIEVSQGIQNINNSIPLITKRRTVVRVYAKNIPGSDVSGVRAQLKVYNVAGSQVTLRGTLKAIDNPIIVRGNGGSRLKLNESFMFIIPKAWMTGNVRFTAEVNYDNAVSDSNSSNNTQTITLATHGADPLKIKMIPIHLHKDGKNVTYYCEAACQTIAKGTLRYHPIETLTVGVVNSALVPVFHKLGREWNATTKKGRGIILDRIAWSRLVHLDYSWHYYGMISPAFGGFGLGRMNGHVALGTMNNTTWNTSKWHHVGGSILAHELGHNQGLKHVNCNGTEAGGGEVDPAYPWSFPNCKLAAVDPNGYYGLDVYYDAFGLGLPTIIGNDPAQAQPQRAFPFMGYENPAWTSPWEFCKLMPDYGVGCSWPLANKVQTFMDETRINQQMEPLRDIQQFALIGGVVDDETNTVELTNFYTQTVVTPGFQREWAERQLHAADLNAESHHHHHTSTSAPHADTWTINVVDAAGGILHTQAVVFDVHDHNGSGIATLADFVPLPAGSKSIQFLQNGTMITERSLSAHAPESRITSTSSALTPNSVIEWTASDSDGDTLYHILSYSADNGTTWLPIALDHDTTTLTVTEELLADIPASPRGKLKLTTTDGFRTTESIAPSEYSVANHAPNAVIDAPSDTMRINPDTQVILEGTATDLEDGALPESAYTWSSNQDGTLGTGSGILVESLSRGIHTLTLTVVDSNGVTSSTSVTIKVGLDGVFIPFIAR